MMRTFVIISLISAPALAQTKPTSTLTKQQAIDYAAMRTYQSERSDDTSIVPVDKGYIMSRRGLQSYVEVKDEKWNAEVNGKEIESTSRYARLKSFFTDFMELKSHAEEAKKENLNDEAVKKLKLRRENSYRIGQELKESLANFSEAEPLKVHKLKTCAEGITVIEGDYLNQPFKISLATDKNEPPTQTTTLTSNDLKLEETEGFVQTGAFRLAVYGSTRSRFTAGKRTDIKENVPAAFSRLLRRFSRNLTKRLPPAEQQAAIPATSFKMTLLLAKKLGSCCADSTCRESIRSPKSSPSRGGLRPYGME